MGRREAWSAANRSTDSRTKPTHWEYRGRRDIGKGTLAAAGDDGGDDRDGEPDQRGDESGTDGNERKRANDGGKLEQEHQCDLQTNDCYHYCCYDDDYYYCYYYHCKYYYCCSIMVRIAARNTLLEYGSWKLVCRVCKWRL